MNIFQNHISVAELAHYYEGNLSLIKRMELELHVAECSRCAGDMAELKRLMGLMRADTAQNGPPSVVDRAIQVLQSRARNTSNGSALRRHIMAVLHFDSLGLAPAFGIRSGKPGARQLLFRAGTDEIDLRIEPDGLAWTVSGQILGEPEAGGKAVLQNDAGTCEVALTELNEFVLPPVPAGTYKLLLSLENVQMEIEEIRFDS